MTAKSELKLHQKVRGAGIPEDAVVASYVAGHSTFTISAPLTADLSATKLIVDPGEHTLTLTAADSRIRVGQLVAADEGIAVSEQALAAADLLLAEPDMEIDVCYTSVLRRSIETADLCLDAWARGGRQRRQAALELRAKLAGRPASAAGAHVLEPVLGLHPVVAALRDAVALDVHPEVAAVAA